MTYDIAKYFTIIYVIVFFFVLYSFMYDDR